MSMNPDIIYSAGVDELPEVDKYYLSASYESVVLVDEYGDVMATNGVPANVYQFGSWQSFLVSPIRAVALLDDNALFVFDRNAIRNSDFLAVKAFAKTHDVVITDAWR